MSSSLLNNFKIMSKFIIDNGKTLNYYEQRIATQISLSVAGLVVAGHACYTYKTTKHATIIIDKKYTFDKNGLTNFMVIDTNGKHYNVNNSFWYWKWDSIEDWHKLQTNKHNIKIKYYGLRVPTLGLFPNIILSRQNESNKQNESKTYYVLDELSCRNINLSEQNNENNIYSLLMQLAI
jgi:hypothetical protein